MKTMPVKKSFPSSDERAVQAISVNLARLAAELEDLRGRASDVDLQRRAKELNAAETAFHKFKSGMEATCHRFQEDMDELFCEHLWEGGGMPLRPADP